MRNQINHSSPRIALVMSYIHREKKPERRLSQKDGTSAAAAADFADGRMRGYQNVKRVLYSTSRTLRQKLIMG